MEDERKVGSYCVCDRYEQMCGFRQMVKVCQELKIHFSESPTLVLHTAEVIGSGFCLFYHTLIP